METLTMRRSLLLLSSILLFTLVSCGGGSSSGGGGNPPPPNLLTITLKGDYFKVPLSGNDPDFYRPPAPSGSQVVPGLVQNTLGPNGMPKVSTNGQNANFAAPSTPITDVDSTTGELRWWSASGAAIASPFGITQEQSGKSDQLPFQFSSNFFPQGEVSDDNFMRTVHWKGTVSVTNASTLIFTIYADDDCWIFLDNTLAIDNGGVKTAPSQPPTGQNVQVTAGSHTIDIFYADRSKSQAAMVLAIQKQ